MIRARLQKNGLAESMQTAKTFETIEEMKQWFVNEYENSFSCDDVSISEDFIFDKRTGWNTRYVITQKYHSESCQMCIGMCDVNFQDDICERH